MTYVYPVYKPPGETPLECLRRYRHRFLEPSVKMTYAGRLDPLAEGVLILLAGPERYRQSSYHLWPKEYVFDVLWGVETDSDDVLGLIEHLTACQPAAAEIEALSYNQKGEINQVPPRLSTPGLLACPAYLKEPNRLPEYPPARTVRILARSELGHLSISASALGELVDRKIDSVQGDFRQAAIKANWRRHLTGSDQLFTVSRFKVRCSAGTYVRALARDLGRSLGTGGVALHIRRLRVGMFSVYNCL